MAEIIDIALLILNQSTLEVEYKYFFNWMLQRRNEKGQLPKQIPGTFFVNDIVIEMFFCSPYIISALQLDIL